MKKQKQQDFTKRSILLLIIVFFVGIGKIYSNRIDSLENELKIKRPESERINTLIELTKEYYQYDLQKAIEYSLEAEQLAFSSNDSTILPMIYRGLGMCYYYISDYEKAVEYNRKSLDLEQLNNNKEGVAAMYNNLAMVYSEIGDYDKSLEYFTKTLTYYEELQDSLRIAIVCGNIGSVYLILDDYDVSLHYLDRAINIFRSNVDFPLGLAKNLATISVVYSRKGQYARALDYCFDALHVARNTDDNVLLGEIYLTLSEVYLDSGNYTKSIQYADSIIYYATQTKALQQLKTAYSFLADSYEGLNQIDLAYSNYKKYVEFKDSIFNDEQRKHIRDIEIKYGIQDKEQRIMLLERDNEIFKQKKIIDTQKMYVLIGVIVIIILLSAFIFFSVRIRMKKMKMEQEKLSSNLNSTHSKLTDYALYIIQKNKMLDALKSDLQKLKRTKSEQERYKIANELVIRLKNEIGIDKDKVVLNEQLKEFGDSFLMKLQEKYPKLTDNDKRLATLLRLKFSSKEISTILNISHNSVNVNRYRLRKKLKLENHENIIEFLDSV